MRENGGKKKKREIGVGIESDFFERQRERQLRRQKRGKDNDKDGRIKKIKNETEMKERWKRGKTER